MSVKQLTENIPVHFRESGLFFYFLADQQGRFHFTNPFFQQRFGKPRSAELFFQNEAKEYFRIAGQCIDQTRETARARFIVRSRAGKSINIQLEFALFESGGLHSNIIQAIGYVVEEKKQELPELKGDSFYRNLIGYSLDGIVLTDALGDITYCSPAVKNITGHEPSILVGANIFQFVHPEDVPEAQQAFKQEIQKQTTVSYILIRLRDHLNNWIWCSVRGHNMLNDPAFNSMMIYFSDESNRKTIEDKLLESEKSFRSLVYNLNQGVMVRNEKTEVIMCNKSALTMLGVTEEQVLGQTATDPNWDIIQENGEKLPEHKRPSMLVMKTKRPVRDLVMGVFRPATNDRVWLLANVDPVFDNNGNIVMVIACFTDITEQKRLSQDMLENEISKQKLLTQATIDGQERERLEIGKELHDNISQHLTTSRLYLEVVQEKAKGELKEMIDLAHKGLSDIINEIRHLSQSLIPPTLGDLGLLESVQDLCESLKRAHTYEIEFFHRYFSEEDLPDNLKLMLFRIIQEQINNIMRHARANNIDIRLRSDAEYIVLSIADDGIGFIPSEGKKGLGFTNIRNRAELFNGKVIIDAAPGEGCTLTVTVPQLSVKC